MLANGIALAILGSENQAAARALADPAISCAKVPEEKEKVKKMSRPPVFASWWKGERRHVQ